MWNVNGIWYVGNFIVNESSVLFLKINFLKDIIMIVVIIIFILVIMLIILIIMVNLGFVMLKIMKIII